MLKKLFSVLTLVAMTSLPALAENSASSDANASAGSSAGAQSGDALMLSGSVGAANCAWAVNLGPLGTSQMADICKRDIASNYWAKRGRMDIADEIMAQSPITQAAVKAMAARAATESSVTTSSMSAPAPAVDLAAVVRSMNTTQRAAYDACTVMQTGEVRFKKPGC